MRKKRKLKLRLKRYVLIRVSNVVVILIVL